MTNVAHRPRVSWGKILAFGVVVGAGLCPRAQAFDTWGHLITSGTPQQTVCLGDTITVWVNFEINNGGWGEGGGWVGVGYGANNNGGGWTWVSGSWYGDNGGNNKLVRSLLNFKPAAAGTIYFAAQGRIWNGDPATVFLTTAWGNVPRGSGAGGMPSFTASQYFTVSALTAPSGQGAAQASSSQINLTWTKGTSCSTAKDTLVVRSTASSFTAPTQGSTYNSGNTLGSGTVIYRGSSTSYSDTSLSAGTKYYYAFYAENWSYYSSAVTASACTSVTISSQPANATVCVGSTAQFSVTASAGTTPTYKWQVWKGSSWADCTASDGSNYATATFTTVATTSGMNGYKYRCVVTDNCGTTAVNTDGNATLTVNTQSTNPTSASANPAAICSGSSSTLTLTGGGGGTSTVIKWYTGSCGGTLAGTGNNLSVSPTVTTTYYGRYEDPAPCSYNTACASVTVTIRPTDSTWDGGGADNNSLTEANWGGDSYPCAGTSSIMRFAGSTDPIPSITHAANSDFYGIWFNSGASAFTLSGNAIDVFGSISNASANVQTINNNLVLSAATTVNATGAGITLGGTNSGSYGITKTGNNTLTLSGANTWGVGLTISAGTVSIGAGGTTGSVSANITDNAALVFNRSDNLTYSGTISGSGTLTKQGAGELTLSGGNSYQGATTISAGSIIIAQDSNLGTAPGSATAGHLTINGGKLEVNSSTDFSINSNRGIAIGASGGAIRVNSGDTTTYGGIMALSGAFTKELAGTLVLTGPNTGSGNVTISGGTLVAGNASALGDATGTTTVSSGYTLALTNGVSIAEPITARGAGYGSGGAIRNLSGNNTITAKVTVNTTDNTRINSDSGTLTLDVASANALESTMSLLFGGNGNIAINDPITVSAGKTVTKDGNGILTLAGTSTYSVNTIVSAGTLLVSGAIANSAVSVGTSGATLAGGGSIGALTMVAGTTVSPGNTASAAGTLTVSGTASLAGTYTCDVTGTGGTDCDKIAASGALSAGAALTINLPASAPAGFVQTNCYVWTIMSGSSVDKTSMSLGTTWASSGSFALEVSGTTIVVTHKPPAPGTPSVTASDGTSAAQVALTWADVANEANYEVWRDTDSDIAGASQLGGSLARDTTSYNDSTATAGTLYYYWVKAVNCNSTATSASDSGYKKLSAPGNVAATDGTLTTGVTVTWDAATGATSYKVFRNTVNNHTGESDLGTQTSGFNDTTAVAGTLYYYWVKAVDSSPAHESDYSSSNDGYKKLSAPANVAATDGTLTSGATITWDAATGATSYKVFRNTANNHTGESDLGTQTSGYNDTTAMAGTLYYYWVKAVDDSPAHESDYSTADTGYKKVSAPANVAATDGSSTSYVTVTWDAATGATSYKVFRSANETETHTSETDLGTQSTPFNDTGAAAGQKYWYWVKAVDDSPAHESDYSSSNDGYRKLATVTITDATDNLGDKVTVTWTDIAGETGYSVWRHTADASGSAVCIANPATLGAGSTTYDDTSAVPGTPYYYWVRGTNSTSSSQSDFQANGSPGLRLATDKGIWDAGGAADGKWSTAANWSGDEVPGTDTNIIFYSGVSATNVNVDSARTILGLRFNDLADTALNITNYTLTINGGGIDMDAGAAGAHVISAPIVLNANQDWTNASSALLTVGGAVSGSGTLAKKGTGTIVLAGNNSYSAATTVDAGALRIQNAGALGGSTAGTTVNTGGALEMQGSITVASEALALNGTGVSANGALRNVLNANSYDGAITLGSDAEIQVDANTLYLGGGLTLGANTLYVQVDGTALTMDAGAATGSKTAGDGAIRKGGAGRLDLRPDGGLTGAIYLDAGEIRQGTGNSSTLPAGGTLTMAGGTAYNSDGSSARTVAKNLVLNGDVGLATYSSGTLAFSGTVDLGGSTRIVTNVNQMTFSSSLSNGGLEKKGAGTMILSGSSTLGGTVTITVGTLQIGAGGAAGYLDSAGIVNNSALAWNRSDNSSIPDDISGSGTLTKDGTGTLGLPGNNSYTGTTTINVGSLRLLHANGLGTTDAGTTVASGASLQLGDEGISAISVGAEALSLAGNGASSEGALRNITNNNTFAGPITLTAHTRINSDTNTLTLNSGTAIAGSGYNLTFGGGGNVTVSSAIDTGAGTVTKDGIGTLTLSGSSGYTGLTTVSAGIVSISNPFALGGAAGGTVVANGAQLKLSGAGTGDALTLSGSGPDSKGALYNAGGGNTVSGAISLGSATRINSDSSTLTLSGGITGAYDLTFGGAQSVTVSGVIGTSTGALTKDGTGTLILSNDNSYSGGTTITAGTLQIGAGSTAGSVLGNVVDNGALVFNRSDAYTFSGLISGSGTVTKEGAGTLTLVGTNTFTGAKSLSVGQINVNHNQALGTAAGAFSIWGTGNKLDNTSAGDVATPDFPMTWAFGTLEYVGSLGRNLDLGDGAVSMAATSTKTITVSGGTLTVGGAISGSGYAITKAGTGTLVLSGTSGYTGGTTINAGTLVMSGSASSSAFSVGGAGTLAGAGTVYNLSVTGTVTPGNTATAVAALTCNDLTLNNGATFVCQIGDWSDTASRDRLVVNGTYGASATVTVKVDDDALSNFNNAQEKSWIIIDDDAIASIAPFTLDQTSNWAQSNGDGVFTLAASGGDLVLSFVTPPASVAASDGTYADKVRVTWTDRTHETGYKVYRHTSNNPGSATQIGGTLAAGTTSYDDTAAAPCTTYYDWVKAVTAGGDTGFGTPDTGYRNFPGVTGLTAEDCNNTTYVALSWDATTGASGYVVWRYTANTPASATAIGTNNSTSTTYNDATAAVGTKYYYWITATNATCASQVADSSMDTGYLKLATVTGFAASDNTDCTKVALTWTDVAGETGYGIWRYTADAYGSAEFLASAAAGATSYNDTSAEPGVPYYYWIRATNSTLTCQGAYQAGEPGQRLDSEPAVQANTITFANVGKTAMDVSWTSGSGDRRIVVARAGEAVATLPVDGTPYTANAIYGTTGTELGAGYVVYSGSGGTATVTGLTAGVTYYFRVFEFENDDCAPDYKTDTASGNPASQATTANAAPSVQAAALSVTAFGPSTLDLGWTRGNGDKVLIVGRETSAAEAPTDNNAYTASAAWGSAGTVGTASKAVFTNIGTSVQVTGLSAGTLYHFAAYEYNEFVGGNLYLTADAPTTNRYTLSTEPANHVTTFSAYDTDPASPSSLLLSWTAAGGSPAPDGYIVLKRVGAYPTGLPADGEGYSVGNAIGDGTVAAIVTPGTATSATIYGLAASTFYNFRIYPFRSNGTSAATFNYKTDGTIPEDFEDTAALNVIKDQFNYTGNLNTQNGNDTYSTGWSGAWSVTYPGTYQPTLASGSKNSPSGYPAEAVNKVQMQATDQEGDAFTARRTFTAFTSGKLYAAALMSFNKNGTARYCGLSLIDTTDATPERAFMGAAQGQGEYLALASHGASPVVSGQTFWGGSEKTHLVIIRYDFDTKKISGQIYRYDGGISVPTSEPETWHINNVDITGRIDSDGINAVQFTCGGKGDVFQFDEVRVADSWAALLGVAGTASTETPTVQAANLNVAANTIATNQFTLNLNGGNGNNVLVVASAAEIAWTPADDTSYTSVSANYGSSTPLASGVYAVYNGTDANPTINLTGLARNTVYYFRAFEHNDEGTSFKYLTASASANPYTCSTLGPPSGIGVGMNGTTGTDLNWSRFVNNGTYFNALVVCRTNAAVSFTPVDGTDYTTGSSLGNGNFVLLANTDWTYYNHTGLTAGSNYYYKFFTRNYNYYSAGVEANVELVATSMLLYEGFQYDSGSLNAQYSPGGTGWDSGSKWVVTDGGGFSDNNGCTVYEGTSLPGTTAAGATGNKIKMYGANDNRDIQADRWFPAISNGTYYLSWRMNYGGDPDGYHDYEWCGMELLNSNDASEAFIGNPYGYDRKLGIDCDGSVKTNVYDYQLYNGSGNDYVIVAKLELDSGSGNDVIRVSAYKSGAQLLGEDPSGWALSVTTAVDNVRRIRLKIGANDANQIGLTYFDEIRLSTNWTATARYDGEQYRSMMESGPKPELIYAGSTYYYNSNMATKVSITDAELTNDLEKIDIAVRWSSPYGLFLTNDNNTYNVAPAATLSGNGNIVPNWDPLAKIGTGEDFSLGFDKLFSGFVGSNKATVATSYYQNAFTGTDFNRNGTNWSVGDRFFVTVSGQTYPSVGATVSAPAGGNAVPDRRAFTINSNLEFQVVDDDPDPPQLDSFEHANATDQAMLTPFVVTGRVLDAYSGIKSNSLKFSLTNAAGVAVFTDQAFAVVPTNGGAQTDWGRLAHTNPAVTYALNGTGTWTIAVAATDYDDDGWEEDPGSTNELFAFGVVDDDPVAPVIGAVTNKGSINYATETAQVLAYDFGTTNDPNLQPSFASPALTVADLAVGGGAPNVEIGDVGAGVEDNYWYAGTNYWEFAVTVQDGFALDLSKICFRSRSTSGSGPTVWDLKVLVGATETLLGSGILTADGNWQTRHNDGLSSWPVTGTAKYRLYGSVAGNNSANWRLDSVSFTGKVDTAGTAGGVATDGDLKTNGVIFTANASDVYSGLYGYNSASNAPAWQLITPVSNVVDFSFGTGLASGTTNVVGTLKTTNGLSANSSWITLGMHTSVVYVTDYDEDWYGDHIQVSKTNTLLVVDDDKHGPVYSDSYARFDGKSAGSEANAVTDGDIAANGLTVSNRVYDAFSGLDNSSLQFLIQDPLGWDTGLQDFTTEPAAGTVRSNWTDAAATTVKRDDFAIDLASGNGRPLGVWTCMFYAVDADADRTGDSLATNKALPMWVIDDDKYGPRMTNVQSTGVAAGVLLATGFETIDGWPSGGIDEGDWSEVANDGTWIGTDAYVNSFNGRGTDATTLGYNAGFNEVNDVLRFPAVNQPGWVTVWARLSGTGETKWILESSPNGTTWTGLGEQSVSTTNYAQHAWLVDSTNAGVQLRLRLTALTTGDRSIYFDDLVVTPYRQWTNAALAVAWGESTDADTGNSGLGEYRLVPLGSNAPVYSTNGISLGTVRSNNIAPSKEIQGIVTGYVFAVDNDIDRGARDRAMGLAIPVMGRLDIAKPTHVPNVAAANSADDPSSQFDLQWTSTGVGPDDPTDPETYPTWGGTERNLLSPWKTYKIYYGAWDPSEQTEELYGTTYIMQTFITSKVYTNWPAVTHVSSIADSSAAGYQPNYQALTNTAQNSIRLYDLDPGEDYCVVVVGVDQAGNEGPANALSWATNDTIKFVVTSAWTVAKATAYAAFGSNAVATLTNVPASTNATALAWLAAGQKQGTGTVTKVYDLIYWDSSTKFRESSNNTWQLVNNVQSNWFVDDGGMFKGRGNLRFYRASYKDRWRTVNTNTLAPQRPLASEEVYAVHNVVLSRNENFVALHGVPYTNTFAAVFGGTNVFPGGTSGFPGSGATLVEFYDAGTNTVSSTQYWLDNQSRWFQMGGSDVTTVEMPSNFFTRGFSITLPDPLPDYYVSTTAYDYNLPGGTTNPIPAMIWSPVLQVPTNPVPFRQTIACGEKTLTPSGSFQTVIYNLVALRLPVATHPSQMNLRESGFVNGVRGFSDEIYTWNTATKTTRSGSTIYCDQDGAWRMVTGNNLVSTNYFRPNDVIVIISRNKSNGSNTWTWTYQPTNFYAIPDRWMGWTNTPPAP